MSVLARAGCQWRCIPILATGYSRLNRLVKTGKCPQKLSRAKLKKPVVVDPDLIWSLPDGEIRRYDSRLNIICRECRKSEVMQRILSFYQGMFGIYWSDEFKVHWFRCKLTFLWHRVELVWLPALCQLRTLLKQMLYYFIGKGGKEWPWSVKIIISSIYHARTHLI